MTYYKSWPGSANKHLNAACSVWDVFILSLYKNRIGKRPMNLLLYQIRKKTQYKFLHKTFYCTNASI